MGVVIAIISICGTVFGIWFYHLKTRNTERLALIQSGVDASLFYPKKKPIQFEHPGLILVFILGVLFLSIGLGIIVGYYVEHLMVALAKQLHPERTWHNYPQAYFTAIFVFSGLGMLASFFFLRRIRKRDIAKQTELEGRSVGNM